MPDPWSWVGELHSHVDPRLGLEGHGICIEGVGEIQLIAIKRLVESAAGVGVGGIRLAYE